MRVQLGLQLLCLGGQTSLSRQHNWSCGQDMKIEISDLDPIITIVHIVRRCIPNHLIAR